ncbi:unnamed protein product [Moneuplotes crassus]|uniref:Uncharacterized protein n=1 Tax=Euplotes crassus TaxID=5936 RepID=A0AAD1UM26_EUPCR|nr:unnamed protein product [Moneuplotes crassus]
MELNLNLKSTKSARRRPRLKPLQRFLCSDIRSLALQELELSESNSCKSSLNSNRNCSLFSMESYPGRAMSPFIAMKSVCEFNKVIKGKSSFNNNKGVSKFNAELMPIHSKSHAQKINHAKLVQSDALPCLTESTKTLELNPDPLKNIPALHLKGRGRNLPSLMTDTMPHTPVLKMSKFKKVSRAIDPDLPKMPSSKFGTSAMKTNPGDLKLGNNNMLD